MFIHPSVSFSIDIFQGDKYASIKLGNKTEEKDVPGKIIIEKKSLTFIPDSYLDSSCSFELVIPSYSLKNKWNTHYQQDIIIPFTTSEKSDVVLNFSPKPGIVDKGTLLTLTSNVPSAQIYYTTDGKEPTSSSNKYQSPIIINKSVTVKAVGLYDGYNKSKILAGEYFIAELECIQNPKDGDDTVGKNVVPSIKYNKRILLRMH